MLGGMGKGDVQWTESRCAFWKAKVQKKEVRRVRFADGEDPWTIMEEGADWGGGKEVEYCWRMSLLTFASSSVEKSMVRVRDL